MVAPMAVEPFGRTIAVPLGVVAARERIDHPWQEFVWRPVAVFLDAGPVVAWRELMRTPTSIHYHVATLPLELHRKECAGYRVNLANGVPSIYVVLREGSENGGEEPVHAHLVTASPFDIEAYGHTPADIVGRVAMPDRLVELVEAFVAGHPVDETFVKRRRQEHCVDDEHTFGQEPIEVLRARNGGVEPGRPRR